MATETETTVGWKVAVVLVAVSSALTLAFVAALGYVLGDKPDEIRLPLLVVAAVAGLLSALALMVAVFAVYSLATPNFALGLPDGSVRAIIALLLIVLFSTTTVFLTVRLKDTRAEQPVVDFAKQLLTILGTLMTSVASFYFGTKAVSDGARVAQNPPPPTPATPRLPQTPQTNGPQPPIDPLSPPADPKPAPLQQSNRTMHDAFRQFVVLQRDLPVGKPLRLKPRKTVINNQTTM